MLRRPPAGGQPRLGDFASIPQTLLGKFGTARHWGANGNAEWRHIRIGIFYMTRIALAH